VKETTDTVLYTNLEQNQSVDFSYMILNTEGIERKYQSQSINFKNTLSVSTNYACSVMSQMNYILDQNNTRKRATIANVYASTPINASVKHYNVSLSGIDTASSSSGGRVTRRLQLEIQGKELLYA